ncbi:hypothetical protein BH24BAC1_BH24BAC1_03200 [soil metagenome]
MNSNLLSYLLEASVCLVGFYGFYRLVLAQSPYFGYNRLYLLGTTLLALLIPLVVIPVSPALLPFAAPAATAEGARLTFHTLPTMLSSASGEAPATAGMAGADYVLLGYLAGAIFMLLRAVLALSQIGLLAWSGAKDGSGAFYVSPSSTYSFLHFIFVNPAGLSPTEVHLLVRHEQAHARQGHTWDVLLLEAVKTLLWFNPVVYLISSALREQHEYLVDAEVAPSVDKTTYANLILTLALRGREQALTNTFSKISVRNRIHRLHHSTQHQMKKTRYLLGVPVLLALLLTFSCQPSGQEEAAPAAASPSNEPVYQVRKISWKGNSAFSDAELNALLRVKEGDSFDGKKIDENLLFLTDGSDVTGFYMDQGYLFFNVNSKNSSYNGQTVHLEIDITEGEKYDFGIITVSGGGGKKLNLFEAAKLINIQPGSRFSRSKLLQAQAALAKSGLVHPEEIMITPLPDEEKKTVDIHFTLQPTPIQRLNIPK